MPTTTLQPDAAAGLDAFIANNAPATNFATDVTLYAGESNEAASIARTLIKFSGLSDGSIPAGVAIDSAILSLFVSSSRSSNARTARAYRQLRAWSESEATWNSYSTGNAWQTAGGFGSSDCEQTDIGSCSLAAGEVIGTEKQFALTPTAIQGIVSGSFANNGFLVKVDTESNDQHGFYSSDYVADTSKRPKLVVAWHYQGMLMLLNLLAYGA